MEIARRIEGVEPEAMHLEGKSFAVESELLTSGLCDAIWGYELTIECDSGGSAEAKSRRSGLDLHHLWARL